MGFGKSLTCPNCGKNTPAFIAQAREKKRAPTPVVMAALGVMCLIAGFGLVRQPMIAGALVIFGGLVVYFIPSVVGHKKRNATAILLLNIFLGWTFLGWVVALVWAATKEKAA